ncbi:MAG TPA: hypothetical protein VIS75_14600 [Chitinophagaceae bacterium]
MKKTAAILLLALLLFNTIGYRIVFNLLEQKATARLENKIDAGKYSEEELVEVKIPLSMPYYSDKDYESVYGETDWNGQHYRYVKRKITGNTLYLLCLPHEEKNQIVTAENEMAKAAVDISTNAPGQQKQTPSLVKLLSSVFEKSSNDFSLAQLSMLNQSWIITDISINNPYTPQTPAQPPEHSKNC